jgi:hypothetical protein
VSPPSKSDILESISRFRFRIELRFLFFFFSSSGAARISQDLRRGSTAEESWSAAALLEQDLVRRSFGWGSVDDDSMPERRSVRQDAQKPVMGITLLLQTSLQLLILKFTSPHKSLARFVSISFIPS